MYTCTLCTWRLTSRLYLVFILTRKRTFLYFPLRSPEKQKRTTMLPIDEALQLCWGEGGGYAVRNLTLVCVCVKHENLREMWIVNYKYILSLAKR